MPEYSRHNIKQNKCVNCSSANNEIYLQGSLPIHATLQPCTAWKNGNLQALSQHDQCASIERSTLKSHTTRTSTSPPPPPPLPHCYRLRAVTHKGDQNPNHPRFMSAQWQAPSRCRCEPLPRWPRHDPGRRRAPPLRWNTRRRRSGVAPPPRPRRRLRRRRAAAGCSARWSGRRRSPVTMRQAQLSATVAGPSTGQSFAGCSCDYRWLLEAY